MGNKLMKVGILYNHGAVLQTYASTKLVEMLGAKPVVLDYKWTLYSDQRQSKIQKVLRRISKLSPGKILWYRNMKRNLEKKIENFRSFNNKYLPLGDMYYIEPNLDAVYIGSDMVFDIHEGYNPYMHGAGISSPYIFSYAASFGYSTSESLHKSGHYEEIKKNICALKEIGYRDEKTLRLCEEMGVTNPLVETIDPVLCYGFENEIEEWDLRKWQSQEYIVVYAYDSTMNDKHTIDAVVNYAKKKGLKLISCGYYHKWCDISVPAAPDEFLEIFKHAKYIITDTFHGTVFSILLHKQFVSLVRNNGFKVQYLLKCASLEDRIAGDPESISSVLEKNISYVKCDEWLAVARESSRAFIRDNLRKASDLNDETVIHND
jgi:hypothetical protein